MCFAHRFLGFLILPAFLSLSACGGRVEPVAAPEEHSEQQRHATVIPSEFQGHMVVSDGRQEDEIAVALKGEKVRWDFNKYPEGRVSYLKTDRCYFVEHALRIYRVVDCSLDWEIDESNRRLGTMHWEGLELFRTIDLDDLTIVERGDGYKIFGQGGIRDYDYRLITVDEASGMKVRIEFPNWKGHSEQGSLLRYLIELRDLNFTVSDELFEIPEDYSEARLQRAQ